MNIAEFQAAHPTYVIFIHVYPNAVSVAAKETDFVHHALENFKTGQPYAAICDALDNVYTQLLQGEQNADAKPE